MNFSTRKSKSRIYPKQNIVAIIRQKSKVQNTQFQSTIDYKNIVLLRKFISAEGRILPRRLTGLNAKQQRYVTKAIKNARMVGLLPFINHSQPPRI
jgi:small subunit ribosomal protein S18|uniref:Small ribosomal subunit protein bS18c n=1 Tax=Binuclearia lauterbornii TaxID=3087189 RepID=A0A097KPE0_9CHLO|nr:ribosomal protein S18 [Binuclearia lauterbornii]AIT95049.1 ribosomal protein S18 [Binuclearia lauterbornii]